MPAPHHNPFALLGGDFEGQLPNPRLKGFSGYATGDLYYRAADGSLAKLGIGSTNDVLTVSAGGVPIWSTGSGGGGGSVQTDYQASDLVITSNATFQDTDLSLSLTAGTYIVEIFTEANVASVPGMVIRVEFTGTETQFALLRSFVRGTTTGFEQVSSQPYDSTFTVAALGVTTYVGVIVVTATGNLKVRARQNTSSATAVTFSAGSWMRTTKIA